MEIGNRRVPLFVWVEIAEKETGVGEDEDEQTGPRILVEGLFSLHLSNPNKNARLLKGAFDSTVPALRPFL